MSLQKECADHLRQSYAAAMGGKLSSGHAHEIVAAFLGYPTAAALQAEAAYPIDNLDSAHIMMPDLNLMDRRVQELKGLPADLPGVDEVADQLCEFLVNNGYFAGEIWLTRDLPDYLISDFIPKNGSTIENDLSGQIALTNAYFDELYVDEVEIAATKDMLVATATGNLNGDNDPDKAFYGDSIAFTSTISFPRAAGRTAFEEPEIETGGEVDDSRYYPDE